MSGGKVTTKQGSGPGVDVTPDNEVIGVKAGEAPAAAPEQAEDTGNLPDVQQVMRMFGPPLPPRE
jgi:hypothetical protein